MSSQDGKTNKVWDEANSWLLRVQSGTMSPEEQRSFEAWRIQDADHEFQFRRAETFWSALDDLAGQVRSNVPATDKSAKAARVGRPVHSRLRDLFRAQGAIAAAVILVLLGSVLWSTIELWFSDYNTQVGEQTSVSLADGSSVHLNTSSAISVELSDQRRSLSLKRGEALFEVAHDPSRPFEVAANGHIVRAIGTTFNVDLHENNTTVSVLEGAVRLVQDGDHVRDIPAGYRLTYAKGLPPGTLEHIDPTFVLAWRRREFVFHDMPLNQIVAELNRYRRGSIIILNRKLGLTRLSGSVTLKDPDQSLQMLQQVLPFHTLRITPYLSVIS